MRFTFKKFLQENDFSHSRSNFPIGYLKIRFPTGIKELLIGPLVSIRFEQNPHRILKSDRKSQFPTGKLPV